MQHKQLEICCCYCPLQSLLGTCFSWSPHSIKLGGSQQNESSQNYVCLTFVFDSKQTCVQCWEDFRRFLTSADCLMSQLILVESHYYIKDIVVQMAYKITIHFLQYMRLEVQVQDVHRVSVWCGISSWFIDSCFLAVFPQVDEGK